MLEDVGCLQKLSDQVISIDFLHHSVIWTNFCDLNILGITGSLKNNGSRKNLLRASISRGLGWWFQWRNWKRSNLPTVSVRRSRFYPLALILDDPGVLIHDSKISKPSNPHDSKWFPKIGLPKSSTIHPQFIHNSSTTPWWDSPWLILSERCGHLPMWRPPKTCAQWKWPPPVVIFQVLSLSGSFWTKKQIYLAS